MLRSLNDVGSFYDEEGYVTHDSDVNQPLPLELSMGSMLDAMSHSQDIWGTYERITYDNQGNVVHTDEYEDVVGSVSDNISLGKGAWVEGRYVIGNGKDVNDAYLTGVADGVAQGLHSANIAITAHFHNTGDVEFVSDANQTAYEKYQAYLASHNYGETSSSQSSCYSVYHEAYSHYHTDSCYNWETGQCWFGREVYNEGGAGWDCEHCHRGAIRWKVVDTHSVDHGEPMRVESYGEGCPDQIPSWGGGYHNYSIRGALKCTKQVGSFPAYYTCGCGYTNGEIIAITIEF